jgi:hypothetical protein
MVEDFEELSTRLRREDDDDSLLGGETIGEIATGGLSVTSVLAWPILC